MPVEMLEHYTIRCADLERTRDFYRDVLGLDVGARPNFGFKGYWLYLGGVPIVHLVDKTEMGFHGDGKETGALDHIAFRGKDIDATRTALTERGLKYRETDVPGFGLKQVFIRDPDGIQIELNFRTA